MRKFSKFTVEDVEPTHVTTFGRLNPVHSGHESMVNQVTNLANKLGASHSVVVTHTHDPVKNPLNVNQKVKHVKRAFPGVNVQSTSPEHPNILHHAAALSDQGVKHLHLVVGSDRVDQFKNLLNSYNGKSGPHGSYNFKSITVHSAGTRDPDAEGLSGASATKMREAAKSGNREAFHSMAPSNMSPEHKDAMMKDVASGMKKSIKEETTSSGDGVRGFGDVSGNPAVQDNPLQQYLDTNALAKDKLNGALIKMLKNSQSNLIGFKEFNPHKVSRDKTLLYYEEDPNGDPLLRDKIRNKGKNNNVTKG